MTPTVSLAIAAPLHPLPCQRECPTLATPKSGEFIEMIDAAVIGLGRWGKSLVTAVQGKSQKLRFVHGVSKEPDDVRAFASQHGFRLSTELDEAIANPEVQAVF